MPSCEVQRTLVKSPPELWAELSDPASLAKHLGEFGEIRTTRVEPETAVEWEAEDVRGLVQLKPSGWGTKVTLTAIREIAPQEAPPEGSVPVEPATAPGPEREPHRPPRPSVARSRRSQGGRRNLTELVAEPALEAVAETALDPAMSTVTEPTVVSEPEPESHR